MKRMLLMAVLGALVASSVACQATSRFFSRFCRGDECRVECQSPVACDSCDGCSSCGDGSMIEGQLMNGQMMNGSMMNGHMIMDGQAIHGDIMLPANGSVIPMGQPELQSVTPGPSTRGTE